MPMARTAVRLQSDARLVELARAGHGFAFEAIVERYRTPLLRYCKRLLPADRAEDVVQQTFVNAFSALRGDDRPNELKPWLYRIAHNAAVNTLKKNGWDYDQLSEDLNGVPQPPDIVGARARLADLIRRIGDLPERQRSALVLREFEGRSYEEIADRLEATPSGVRQLLNRARSRLRDGLGALVPLPVFRALFANVPPGGAGSERLTEVAAGAGATGAVVKVGAGVLAAATLATGAGVAVQHKSHVQPPPAKHAAATQLHPALPSASPKPGVASVADSTSHSAHPSARHPGRPSSVHRSERGTSAGDHRGPGIERHRVAGGGPVGRHHEQSGERAYERSGSGDDESDHSGSSDERSRQGSGESIGSGEADGGSGSGERGSSGSDEGSGTGTGDADGGSGPSGGNGGDFSGGDGL